MTDPVTVATILSYVATKVIDKVTSGLLDKGSESLILSIRGDKSQNAFKVALGEAIQHYATSGSRLTIAEPLLREDGLLSKQSMIEEISQTLSFGREPNYQLIGVQWKSLLESPPARRDFTNEAHILVNYLEEELKASDVFGPVMERQAIDAIASDITSSVDILGNMLEELTQLRSMIDGHLGDFIQSIAGASQKRCLRIRHPANEVEWSDL